MQGLHFLFFRQVCWGSIDERFGVLEEDMSYSKVVYVFFQTHFPECLSPPHLRIAIRTSKSANSGNDVLLVDLGARFHVKA